MLPNRGKSLFILEQQAFACNNWLFKNVTKCSQMLAHREGSREDVVVIIAHYRGFIYVIKMEYECEV